jgi:uncharacterized protein (TIGR00369 family)
MRFFWQMQTGQLPEPAAARTLGMLITHVDGERGSLSADFDGQAAFLNPAGHIQGGFLAAMLDDTLGAALAATLAAGQFAPTLQLNVQFLHPAQPGALHGSARVVQRGQRVCFLSGELRQGQRIVATATATAAMSTLPPP